uniref:Uncharacterized protein n=1 Tax=viral metagenome TaxID=1070528 RepID=A0A6M3Y3K8_9ZZZZ
MAINYVQLKAYNSDLLKGAVKTYLTSDLSAVGAALTVRNITGFGVGDYILIGEFGQEKAEIVRLHASTAPTGSTITLAANTSFTHEKGTPIYRIDRNQVEFSRATTLTGAKSVLATSSILADELETIYEDSTNTTGYGFYRFKNEGDTTYTNYSESIPYAGYGSQTLKKIFDSALRKLGLIDALGEPQFSPVATRGAAFDAVCDCQEEIALLKHRWSYLLDFEVNISELATGQDTYSLPTNIAFENGQAAIQNVKIGSRDHLKYIDKEWLNNRRKNVVKTTLGAAISATTDTTVTLTDVSDFDDSGSIYVIDDDAEGYDTISYTSKTNSTNLLNGVTDITETHADAAIVWQGVDFGKPSHYTVYEDNIILDVPPDTDWNDYNLLADIYTTPTVVNDLADEAQFPSAVIKPYVAYYLAEIIDDGPSNRSQAFYSQYEKELSKLIDKENNGQFIKMQPNRKPDVTSNFANKIIRNAEDDNS